MVVARWENELDVEQINRALNGAPVLPPQERDSVPAAMPAE